MENNDWTIELLRYPTEADWKRCLYLARATQGKFDEANVPSYEWRHRILRAEHSPIRTLMFTIEMKNIPYYSSVHFVRHKYGVEHYVQSQRVNPDRGAERQDAPVTHTMDLNAQALINIMRKRLCYKADHTTHEIALQIKAQILYKDGTGIWNDILVPECCYRANYCPEMKPCDARKVLRDNQLKENQNGK